MTSTIETDCEGQETTENRSAHPWWRKQSSMASVVGLASPFDMIVHPGEEWKHVGTCGCGSKGLSRKHCGVWSGTDFVLRAPDTWLELLGRDKKGVSFGLTVLCDTRLPETS